MATDSKKYFAFISYQRQDEEWAEWLQHRLEHYHLPANIVANHPELPKDITTVGLPPCRWFAEHFCYVLQSFAGV